MKKGIFVLKNRAGQVVRTFDWDKSALMVVLRHDTHRVETLDSVEELRSEGIAFKILAETSPSEIKSRPLQLVNGGEVEFTDSLGQFSPNYKIQGKQEGDMKAIARWTAAAHIAVLVIFMLLSQVFPDAPTEPVVVKVVKQAEAIQAPKPKPVKEFTPPVKPVEKVVQKKKVVVKVAEKKIDVKKVVRSVEKPVIKQTRTNGRAHTPAPAAPKKNFDVNNVGALGILGGPNSNSKKAGGFDASKVTNTRAGGSGGLINGVGGSKALGGAGLLATTAGSGDKAQRVAGYGTRGRSGGVEGYGTVSMVGTGGAGFYAPSFDDIAEDTDVEGGLDRSQIAAVIQRHLGEIRFCYEKGLQVKPDLSGRVGVRFVINGGGRVSLANVAHSSLRQGSVESCITSKLKTWAFPKPVGGVDVKVTYPFVLKRNQG